VGLKGELVRRILVQISHERDFLSQLQTEEDILSLLDRPHLAHPAAVSRRIALPNPNVDWVIDPPNSWKRKAHRSQLSFFIPDWNDHVDPDYDFETDTHSHGAGTWINQVYAHQLYDEPNYDGILVSKAVVEQGHAKRDAITNLGIHRYLRVPNNFSIMGDCGAFSYVREKEPWYKTPEILDYYTNLGFDYGVSIDHLIFGAANEQERLERYQLTISNAEAFLHEHRARGLRWTPIGAVQGWDTETYASAARQYVEMGYRYIGLGGLVRTQTKDILEIAYAVNQQVNGKARVHLIPGFPASHNSTI
jgi:hypothetical protein